MKAYSEAAKRRAHKSRASVSLHHMDGETITAPPPEDNRPTPEQMARGEWTTTKAGAVTVNLRSTHLRDAARETEKALAINQRLDLTWRMTPRRVAAGHEYERHWRAIHGSPNGKDSLDFAIRGGRETGPEYAARLKETDRKIDRAIPPGHRGVLWDICVDGQPTDKRTPTRVRWRWLIEGLDALADVFGLDAHASP